MQTKPVDPNRFAQQLFTPLPRRYDLLEEVFSFGQNARWRKKMIQTLAANSPQHVLDVATGTAGVAIAMALRLGVSVTGIDITHEMLALGKDRVLKARLTDRVHLVLGRAEQLPFADETIDAITFTYLLRYVTDPSATLQEMARVVRPGGVMASLEFGLPPNPFWRFWWWLYTRVVLPLAGLLFGRGWYRVGRFLGPSISAYYRRYPLEWHLAAWKGAGMVDVGFVRMSLGGGLVMWGRKPLG